MGEFFGPSIVAVIDQVKGFATVQWLDNQGPRKDLALCTFEPCCIPTLKRTTSCAQKQALPMVCWHKGFYLEERFCGVAKYEVFALLFQFCFNSQAAFSSLLQ